MSSVGSCESAQEVPSFDERLNEIGWLGSLLFNRTRGAINPSRASESFDGVALSALVAGPAIAILVNGFGMLGHLIPDADQYATTRAVTSASANGNVPGTPRRIELLSSRASST